MLPPVSRGGKNLKILMLKSRLPISNRLLAAVPRVEYQKMADHLDPVTVSFGEVLYEPGEPIRHVYFPQNALVALLTLVDSDSALAVSLVAREGMVGIASALGLGTSPVRAVVQVTGTALRMTAAHFRATLKDNLPLQQEVHLYTHALMVQIAQTAACNRFHLIEARLARWLLMTRDRVNADHFYLTHEFLGDMLGVRRVGVTHAAMSLKQQNLIDYSRGNIDLIDIAGLKAASCSCYPVWGGGNRVV